MNCWKRTITKCLVFLFIGAVVNVAVAWGCALWAPTTGADDAASDRVFYRWYDFDLAPLDLHWPPDCSSGGWSGPGISVGRINHPLDGSFVWGDAVDWQTASVQGCDLKAGLPLRTLRGGRYLVSDWQTGEWVELADAAIRPDRRHWGRSDLSDRPAMLPLRPIWPGFAVNTAFYAVILWLLLRGPFALRRYVRWKRGHCIKCGYDLRGKFDAGCPECGWNRVD